MPTLQQAPTAAPKNKGAQHRRRDRHRSWGAFGPQPERASAGAPRASAHSYKASHGCTEPGDTWASRRSSGRRELGRGPSLRRLGGGGLLAGALLEVCRRDTLPLALLLGCGRCCCCSGCCCRRCRGLSPHPSGQSCCPRGGELLEGLHSARAHHTRRRREGPLVPEAREGRVPVISLYSRRGGSTVTNVRLEQLTWVVLPMHSAEVAQKAYIDPQRERRLLGLLLLLLLLHCRQECVGHAPWRRCLPWRGALRLQRPRAKAPPRHTPGALRPCSCASGEPGPTGSCRCGCHPCGLQQSRGPVSWRDTPRHPSGPCPQRGGRLGLGRPACVVYKEGLDVGVLAGILAQLVLPVQAATKAERRVGREKEGMPQEQGSHCDHWNAGFWL